MKKVIAHLIREGYHKEAADLEQVAGLFDFIKKKKEPSSLERVQYIARQIDEQLVNVPPSDHKRILDDALTQWKIIPNEPKGRKVLELLKNYRHLDELKRKKHWTDRTMD